MTGVRLRGPPSREIAALNTIPHRDAGRTCCSALLFPLMRDTQLAAESIRLTAVRQLSPAARVRHALELSEWARSLALAGLRARHPACGEIELVELLLGTCLSPAANRRERR